MSAGLKTDNSTAAIWGRLITPRRGDLSPEFARMLLEIDFPPRIIAASRS